MPKWILPIISLLAILSGMGFASIVETKRLIFWGVYAAIGTAFMLCLIGELATYVCRQKWHLLIGMLAFVLAFVLSDIFPHQSLVNRIVERCRVILIWLLAWEAAEILLKAPALAYTAVCVGLWLIPSQIKPAGSSYMVIGALSLLAYRYAQKARRAPNMKPYFSGILKYAPMLLSFVASFCLFGYRLFLSGDFIRISRSAMGFYLLGVLWMYPVILSCLYGLEWIRERLLRKSLERNEISVKEARKVRWIATACFMGVMLLSLMAYYPGGYPNDSVDQFTQARTGDYSAWHSVCHTLIIKLVLSICDREAAVVLFQMMLFAILVGKMAVLAYEIGLREKAIYAAVTVFGLLPNQFTTVISPLKDFMFTYALLWLTLLLIDLVRNIDCIKKPSYIIKLSLALFFTYALRHNGIVPFLFVVVLLLILTVRFRKQIKWRACLAVVQAAVLIGLYRGPLFTTLEVEPNAVTPYVTMFCAVGSCLNKDLLLSEPAMEKLETVMPLENWKEYYSRFAGHDHYMFENPSKMDLTSFSAREAFSIYLEALIRYPDVVIKDRLDGMNLLWDITLPNESFQARVFDFVTISEKAGFDIEGYSDGEYYTNHSVLAKVYRKLNGFAFTGEREIDQISNLLLWRTGIYLLFMMALAVFWAKNKLNQLWWAAMPLVGNTVGMMLVLYHQSYRYVFYVQLLTIALTLATFVIVREQKLPLPDEAE